MTRIIVSRLALGATLSVLLLAGCTDEVVSPEPMSADGPSALMADDGTKLTGYHFTLNIIGVDHAKTAEMEANNDNGIGSRIFVLLNYDDGDNTGDCFWYADPSECDNVSARTLMKENKIFLTESPDDDFAVLDANATDKDGGEFELPNPDPDGDGVTTYLVFARALGKPGGKADMSTCATQLYDPDGVPGSGDEYEEVICSTEAYVYAAERKNGRPVTENVTEELLFVSAYFDPDDYDTDSAVQCLVDRGDLTADDPLVEQDPELIQLPLFDRCLENYFWDYDNNGLKLLQLRFYEVEEG